MPKLTKTLVEAIEPENKDVLLWDSEIKGFAVKVTPKGKRSYILKYRVGGGRTGKTRKPTIGIHGIDGMTTDKARKIAGEWKAIVNTGGDPSGERQAYRKAPTLSDLKERFIEDYAKPHKKASGVEQDERNFRVHIIPKLGADTKVKDVTRQDVMRMHNAFRDTPSAANRALKVLSKAMNMADVWDMRPGGSNPCTHIKRFKEAKRNRFLSLDEFGRIGKALSDMEKQGVEMRSFINAVRLLVFTGCRRGEILSLRWDEVDFPNHCLNLQDSKTGPKRVLLNLMAYDVLKNIEAVKGNPWVITGRNVGGHLADMRKPWARLMKMAEIKDRVTPNTLRHSFASVAVGSGQSLEITGKLLGQTQKATTERYAHLADDPLKRTNEVIGNEIGSSFNG
jgi:integrase